MEGGWTRAGKILEMGEETVRVSSLEGPKSYLNVNSLGEELVEDSGDLLVLEYDAVVAESGQEDAELELDDEDDP